jgi:hypothetical protein
MFEVMTLGALFHHGAAVPLVWIIGLVLIVGGLISMVRGGIAAGIILVILGIILGGLQVV